MLIIAGRARSPRRHSALLYKMLTKPVFAYMRADGE
jgi:hypothetical protein